MSSRLNKNSSKSSQCIKASVRLQDTENEGRPSIYLFIFVNPLSGNRQGSSLIHLPIQHFRLRRLPQVQVEIHNCLDVKDRQAGMQRIALIEDKVKRGDIPAIRTGTSKRSPSRGPDGVSAAEANAAATLPEGSGALSPSVQTRHIHVWSAGGDGTVMSVLGMLEEYDIDLDLVFFSCIPFGTGNDFSQVLGWGRTTSKENVVGADMSEMEALICDRLEHADAARLDVFQVTMESHDSGHVRKADSDDRQQHCLTRKMSNYMSIGVQGYVGSGFERKRTNRRLLNIMVYTVESFKWAFWRKFPPVNRFVSAIVCDGERALAVPADPQQHQTSSSLATLNNTAIDLVIQNIPHIWGREVDLWSEARTGLESVSNRSGCTDPVNWTPQLANDGKLEVIALGNMFSYVKKLLNVREHVSRVGQFKTPFEIVFREPAQQSGGVDQQHDTRLGCLMGLARCQRRSNRYERKNVMGVMCDGEFFLIKDPKAIRFERSAQIWALGKSDHGKQGRLVKDEQLAAQEERATTA